mgnify:CR=1 FL=1|tara:strand:+ start:341 stop:763 length:423 start_codon:yes stop_codon:yes gene_type:complete
MAHYAKLGINSKVIGVHVVDNKDILNADGIEDEEVGRQYLERIHGWPLWKKTSYNTRGNKHISGDNSKAFRGNYAGIGYIYDEDNDMFLPKKPFSSWILNTSEARWESPIGDAPELSEAEQTTHRYDWDEANGSWNKVEI